MISKIIIENFKSIKDKVEIDLKPITLLFGPNSAGKSTILQAFHYIKEILDKNNVDAGKTELGGDAIDLGGFKNLVHKHDINLPIVIGVEVEEDDWAEPELYDQNSSITFLKDAGYDKYLLEFTVEWDKNASRPVMTKYTVSVKNKLIAKIEMAGWGREYRKYKSKFTKMDVIEDLHLEDRPKYHLTYVDFDHPQFDYIPFELEDYELEANITYKNLLSRVPGIKYNLREWNNLPEKNMDLFLFYNHNAFLTKPISLDIEPSEELVEIEIEAIENTLTHIFVTPLNLLIQMMNYFRYIGPLRDIPERGFVPERFLLNSRWSSGLGAWDRVYDAYLSQKDGDKELIENVNKHMDKLQSGYSIKIKNIIEIEEDDPVIYGLNKSGRLLESGEEVRETFKSMAAKSILEIYDERHGITVAPKDIGTGIMQMFPIIVGAVDWEGVVLAIEQPELHIHPALQQRLADAIIPYANDNRLILIETHSEHLILRFKKRIQQTIKGDLPEPELKLENKDLSISYIDPSDSGVNVETIEIDEKGKFTKKWPHGFFEERYEDVF